MIKNKQLFYFGTFTLLLALLSGCSSTTPSAKGMCGKDTIGSPSWVCKPEVADSYVGLGMSEKADAAQMKQVALKAARLEITKQMQTEVKNRLDKLSASAEISNKEAVDNLFKAISKEVSKTNLHLAKEAQTWTSASGKLYLLAIAPKANFDADMKQAIQTSYAKDGDAWLNYQSNQSMDAFEREFDVVLQKKIETLGAQAFRVETIANTQVGRNKRK